MISAQIQALRPLIGRPYRLGATGPDAFDCYGLACEVLRLAAIEMPIASRVGDYGATIREHAEHRNWQRVDWPEEFDLVLMANVKNRDRHLGVYLRPATAGQVIHAIAPMGVCLHDVQALQGLGMNKIRFYRRKISA